MNNKSQNEVSSPTDNIHIIDTNRDINLDDYVTSVPVDEQTKKDIVQTFQEQREKTRSNLAMTLVKMFGATMAVSYLTIVLLIVFCPESKAKAVQDLIPLLLTPQISLVGVAVGFYFGENREY